MSAWVQDFKRLMLIFAQDEGLLEIGVVFTTGPSGLGGGFYESNANLNSS